MVDAVVDAIVRLGHVRLAMATHPGRPADTRVRTRPGAVDTEQVPRALEYALLALAIVAAALVRMRLAGVPLERDEGEYAYAGQLILQGVAPYQLVYNMKFPGTYLAYSLILALFGQTPAGIHIGLLLANAATTFLVYLLARRLTCVRAALVAASAFALLSLDRWIMGVFAHATHFVILPAVAGLLLLDRALEGRRLALFLGAGLLLGVSVLMKQHAAVFVVFALAFGLWRDLHSGPAPLGGALAPTGTLLLGAATPFAILCAVMAALGLFGRFWFWTISYAREYAAEVPWTNALPSLLMGVRSVTVATWPLWLLAVLGLAGLWLLPWRRETRAFVTAFLLASFLAACPGFYFRQHYFIVMLPALAMLVGVAVVSIQRLATRRLRAAHATAIATVIFLAAVLAYVVPEREYLVSMSARDLSRTRYGRNPFVEAPEIGRYLKERTSPSDRIAVIGSEPEILFYAHRRSATGYIYMYPLTERQAFASRMQDEMIREIETAQPAYVVFVAIRTSWVSGAEPDRRILGWADRLLRQCYEVVGIAERLPEGSSSVRWDAETVGYQPLGQDVIYTLKRRSDAPCTASGPEPQR